MKSHYELLYQMSKEERDIGFRILENTRDMRISHADKKTVEMEKKLLVELLLNFYETLAMFANRSIIDDDIAKKFWKNNVSRMFKQYKKEIVPDYDQLIELHKRWEKK